MPNDDPKDIAESLRLQAFENPRLARAQIEGLLNGEVSVLRAFLAIVSDPGYGRIRQMICNAVSPEDIRADLGHHFTKWLEHETDEFTRQAIERALRSNKRTFSQTTPTTAVTDPMLVEMYRYATSRIGHELRNALLGPKKRLLQLRAVIQTIADETSQAHIQQIVSQLEQDFARAGRVCELEPDDQYFAMAPYVLADWIEAMNTEYSKRFQKIDLTLNGNVEAKSTRVVASHHLLRTIFWNLWLNAHQAVGEDCRILANFSIENRFLCVVVSDNGDGLPLTLNGFAFNDAVSTRSPNRGRGLLEVQLAISELHGNASLAEQAGGDLRVSLNFPLERQ